MDYPTNLPLSAASVNISDGEFSPFYDIIWSIKYEIINWSKTDEYGLCFFLQDSSSNIKYGGIGIDLGYSGAPVNGTSVEKAVGLQGGKLGIGLDTRGVFAAKTAWPGGLERDGLVTGLQKNAITVRGSESSGFTFLDLHEKIEAFDLLSDGIKTLRARLGNFGRTIYIDYRGPGDTDYQQVLAKDVDLSLSEGDRLTPGVSFVKHLTKQTSNLNIKVHSFHIEGKDNDPDKQVRYPEPLVPQTEVQPYAGSELVIKPDIEIVPVAPVKNIVMCNPPTQSQILISKTALQNAPELGDIIDYTITITNQGEFELSNIVVFDTIPTVERLNITGEGDLFSGNQTLSAGETKTVAYKYQTSAKDGTQIENTATVTTNTGLVVTDTAITTLGGFVDLVINKEEISTGPYKVSDSVLYKVTVENPNNVEIADVRVVDTLQDDPNFNIEINTDNLLNNTTTLSPGDSASATYSYTITNTSPIINNAYVESVIGKTYIDDPIVISDIEGLASLRLNRVEKSTGLTTLGGVELGVYGLDTVVEYEVEVYNPNERATISNIVLSDSLSADNPDGFEIVSGDSLFTGTDIGPDTALSATYRSTINTNTSDGIESILRVDWPTRQSSKSIVRIDTVQKGCVNVSLVSEASNYTASTEHWALFRTFNPNTPFYILLDEPNNIDNINIPTEFENDTNAEVVIIPKDPKESNWFNILNLESYGPDTRILFWYEESSSFDGMATHTTALTALTAAIEDYSMVYTLSSGDTQDYFLWHSTPSLSCTF